MTDNVRQLRPARRKAAPKMRSHEEIYDLVASANRAAENAGKLAKDAVSRADLSHLTGQRVEAKLDALVKTIGTEGEDEHGKKIGSGLFGRFVRLEEQVVKRFLTYDGWTKLAAGSFATACVFVTAIWWLLQDKIALVLK